MSGDWWLSVATFVTSSSVFKNLLYLFSCLLVWFFFQYFSWAICWVFQSCSAGLSLVSNSTCESADESLYIMTCCLLLPSIGQYHSICVCDMGMFFCVQQRTIVTFDTLAFIVTADTVPSLLYQITVHPQRTTVPVLYVIMWLSYRAVRWVAVDDAEKLSLISIDHRAVGFMWWKVLVN